ncbi:MAG: HAMP domain-containing sensor histidine kinase [Deltaproteobacteria bacterium]
MTRRPVPRIAVRIGVAFAIVLLFFVVALVVTSRTLDQIAAADDEVARLDRAKHAGHHVAAMAREMYIHQAHTIVTFGFSHLEHYEQWVAATKKGIDHLLASAPTDEDRVRAAEIGGLANEIDAEFKRLIIPAIERGDRAHLLEYHDQIDAVRQQVIASNRALAADFEERSDRARASVAVLRSTARWWILGCTGLAALAAALLGIWLLRSVLEPITVLRNGALRIAEGDLTHRIAWGVDDEFGELADTFNGMTAKLAHHQAEALNAQRLRLLGEVTAGVAHEMNNPIGVILGYLRLIEKDGNASADRLATITEEARQCQRIVADLLAVVRPSELEPSDVDLARLVRESVDRQRERTAHPDLSGEIGDALITWGDPNKLRQVVDNLIANAVDACPEGPVRVRVESAGNGARVSVVDAGPGVPQGVADRVFDPFFTTKADGTGLGLAISRAIVEAHEGELRLVDGAAHGATFELHLPRTRPTRGGS